MARQFIQTGHISVYSITPQILYFNIIAEKEFHFFTVRLFPHQRTYPLPPTPELLLMPGKQALPLLLKTLEYSRVSVYCVYSYIANTIFSISSWMPTLLLQATRYLWLIQCQNPRKAATLRGSFLLLYFLFIKALKTYVK